MASTIPGTAPPNTSYTDGVDYNDAADLNQRTDDIYALATQFGFLEATELTIDAAGEITWSANSGNYFTVDTFGDAASDDLETINGGVEALIIFLRPENDARTIVIKHDVGNISCGGQADITLDDVEDLALLIYDDGLSKWLAFSGGGGAGMSDLVDDLTPQLGGDLDLNGNNFDFPTTANISDCLDEDNMVSDSATKLATQQSIKAYVDNTVGLELIEDVLLSSDVASFDFTSIPATYKHLRLMCSLRSDRGAVSDGITVRFNNDAGANYNALYYDIHHNNVLVTNEALAQNEAIITGVVSANGLADQFDPSEIFIPNYASADINKSLYVSAGVAKSVASGNVTIRNGMGLWDSTAAINRITIIPQLGANWKEYSRISLYGMK